MSKYLLELKRKWSVRARVCVYVLSMNYDYSISTFVTSFGKPPVIAVFLNVPGRQIEPHVIAHLKVKENVKTNQEEEDYMSVH